MLTSEPECARQSTFDLQFVAPPLIAVTLRTEVALTIRGPLQGAPLWVGLTRARSALACSLAPTANIRCSAC
jgi:hypothetical protein